MSVEEIIEPVDPTTFYRQLRGILDKHDEDVDSMLKTVFSFVKTKTDYFTKVKDPRIPVIHALQAAGVKKPAAHSQRPAAKTKPEPAATSPEPESSTSVKEEEEKEEDKGLKPNAGNGADLESYSWTQSLDVVTIVVPGFAQMKAKEVQVEIEKSHLCIKQKSSGLVVLEGELSAEIKPEECFWSLVDGHVEVTLQKTAGMTWWKSVIAGDPEIDTQKVTPENSNLADLDAETRQTVEKMMFDQQRKQQGLPTSEDMKKQEMLQKFMKQHPEMDFSQAKFN